MSRFLGVDIGGTKSAAVLVDETGMTVARRWLTHGGMGRRTIRNIVLESINDILNEVRLGPDEVTAYGVAVAGLVSSDQSMLVHAAKLRVHHSDLGVELSSLLGRRVLVENDANATLYGHQHHCAPSSPDGPVSTEVVLLLTLGTGIGGAIMVGGSSLLGAHGFAAELGHVPTDYDDPRRCLCGGPGCLENFASGRGVEELAALHPPPPASRAAADLGLNEPVRSPTVVELARLEDPWAVDLLEHCGAMLGRALCTLCTVLDPTSVVIGGSFGHAAQHWLLPAAVAEMTRRWPFAEVRPLPELQVDAIGPYAAATGAALLARASELERMRS
jgi:predicted NBD/HSP70 family sugar kinase